MIESLPTNTYLMSCVCCRECIKESMKHSKACPTCKCEVSRRDIEKDEIIDTFVSHLKVLDGLKDSLIPSMIQLEADGEGRGRERVEEMMLPWLQGVQDEEYQSPSQSFSGSALEQLKKRKSSRSPSPCSPATQAGGEDDVLVQPTQHVAAVVPQDGTQDVTPWRGGQKSMIEFMKKASVDRSETPHAGGRGTADFDNILAGLEAGMKTAEKVTPTTMLLPASFPSSGESNKENDRKLLQESKSQGKTTRRARSSRRAIEEAKTPPTREEPSSEEKRRIPARLLPWSCIMCTFDNKGSSVACEMCGHAKGPEASQTCPDTIAKQKSIASQAKSSSAKKRSKQAAVTASHIIDSTPHEARPVEVEVHVDDAQTPAGEAQGEAGTTSKGRERPSQPTLTGTQGRSKRGRHMESRLANVSSKKDPKPGSCEQSCPTLKTIVVTASSLNTDEKAKLKAFCRTSGACYSSNWTPKVTHVICPALGKPANTFKYLMALLTETHVVSMKWVDKCAKTGLREREDKYSLVKSCSQTRNVLSAYEIQVQPHASDGSGNVKQAKDLLKAAGARVVNRLPRSDQDRHGLVLVLDHTGNNLVDDTAIVEQAWFGRACGANIPVVKQAWLRTSIVQGQPANVQDFTI